MSNLRTQLAFSAGQASGQRQVISSDSNYCKNDSIWKHHYSSSSSSSSKDELSQAQKDAQNLANIAAGISIATAVVGLGASAFSLGSKIADAFTPAPGTPGAAGAAGATSPASSANDAASALQASMDKANSTGDWSGVQKEVTAGQATYDTNTDSIGKCDTAIADAKKLNETTQASITELKDANAAIDKTDIPAAKAELEKANKGADSQKEATIADAKVSYDAVMNDKNSTSAQKTEAQTAFDKAKADAEQVCKETKAKAQKDYDKKYALLTDTQKQNSTKIKSYQEAISKQDEIIKAKTDDKAKLTEANAKLKTKLTEANAKLELHATDTTKEATPKDQAKTETDTKTETEAKKNSEAVAKEKKDALSSIDLADPTVKNLKNQIESIGDKNTSYVDLLNSQLDQAKAKAETKAREVAQAKLEKAEATIKDLTNQIKLIGGNAPSYTDMLNSQLETAKTQRTEALKEADLLSK